MDSYKAEAYKIVDEIMNTVIYDEFIAIRLLKSLIKGSNTDLDISENKIYM